MLTTSGSLLSGLISAPLAGSGIPVVKSGLGTVTLSAANTYSGDTDIQAGTLKLAVGGSISNSPTIIVGDVDGSGAVLDVSSVSPFTVGAGQTLKGHGTVVGTLAVAGHLAPGASPGTLNVGDIEFNNNSELDIELASATSYSQLISSGTITVDSNVKLAVTLTGGFDPANGDVFNILGFNTISGTFAPVALPDLDAGLSWKTDDLYTTGQIQVIPEPATLVLLGFGLMGVIGMRKRRKTA